MTMTELSEIEKRIVRAEGLGQEWANADAQFYQLDETKKSVLADLMKDLDDGDTSETKLERLARSSKVWKEHIHNLSIAKGAMLRAKVKYEASVAWAEAARTAEASARARMQFLKEIP